MNDKTIIIRLLDQQAYLPIWAAMQTFTNQRTVDSFDEIWLLEHPPTFTQGQSGKPEHILNVGAIPLIQIDRGGQVTYHGPGQIILYTLIDINRKKFSIRQLITLLEQSVLQLLQTYGIAAESQRTAPGIYIAEKKICSLGLRIRRGCSYHGLALNVDMDLEPFSRINPCGYPSLKMTQLTDIIGPQVVFAIGRQLVEYLVDNLGYTNRLIKKEQWYGPENNHPC